MKLIRCYIIITIEYCNNLAISRLVDRIIRFEVKYEKGSPKGFALRILISRSRLNLVVRYFGRPGGGKLRADRAQLNCVFAGLQEPFC